MKFSFRPTEGAFYELFTRAAQNLVKGTELLARDTRKTAKRIGRTTGLATGVLAKNASDIAETVGDLAGSVGKNASGLAGTLSLDLFALPAEQCTAAGVAGATPIGSSGAGLAGTATPIVPVERSLFSGAAEDLCARISVPTEIGNEYQNASADLQLTFLAEQDPTDPHR